MIVNQIKAEKLTVAYNSAPIISDLEIEIPKGKITVIIGPNGCGKSTLLKALGRVLKPKDGSILLNGEDIFRMSTIEVAKRMAVLPQSPVSPLGLTVGELVSYGRYPHRNGFRGLTSSDKNAIYWALEETHLLEQENIPVDMLSGGQRQRVWIAMAIAQQTGTILLDEPTTYLDLSYQLEILELLYRINRQQRTTVVMVLHDLNLAARHADYMVAVREGKIVCKGTPEQIMQPKVLRDTFSIDAVIDKDARTGRPICVTYDLIRKRKERNYA